MVRACDMAVVFILVKINLFSQERWGLVAVDAKVVGYSGLHE